MSVFANTPSTSPTLRPRRWKAIVFGAEPFHCTTSCQCVSHRKGTLTGASGGAVLLQLSRSMPVARRLLGPAGVDESGEVRREGFELRVERARRRAGAGGHLGGEAPEAIACRRGGRFGQRAIEVAQKRPGVGVGGRAVDAPRLAG